MNKISSLSLLSLSLIAAVPGFGQTKLPPAALDAKIASADGGPTRSLSEFVGRPFVLFVFGRNSAEAANAQQVQLGLNEATSSFVRVSVADLKGIPFFIKSTAKKGIKRKHQEANAQIVSGLQARQKPLQGNRKFLTLLDFSSNVPRQLGISGQSQSNYHVFVVAPSGAIILRVKQTTGGASESAIREQIATALSKASE